MNVKITVFVTVFCFMLSMTVSNAETTSSQKEALKTINDKNDKTLTLDKLEPSDWARMFLTIPLSISLDGNISNNETTISSNGILTRSSNNGTTEQYSMNLQYTLPVSSLWNIVKYIQDKKSPLTSTVFLTRLNLYANGGYQNALDLPDSSSTVKINETWNYKIGISYKSSIDDMLAESLNWKKSATEPIKPNMPNQ